MPRLLVFAACEKVVIAQEDNSGSLISILQGFDIGTAPANDEIIIVPQTWYVFTLWESINEEPLHSRQRLQLIAPDRTTVLLSAEVPIVSVENRAKRFHRAALRRTGFQVRGIGDYMLRLSIKEGDGEFSEVAVFPIPVSVVVPPQATT